MVTHDQMRHGGWQLIRWGLVAMMLGLLSCVNGNSRVSSAPSDSRQNASAGTPRPSLDLELFSHEELLATGGGGCGMAVLPHAKELPHVGNPAGMLLFHGVEQPMMMKINQSLVAFELERSQGTAFYGQRTQQTFRHTELKLTVDVRVALDEPGSFIAKVMPNTTVRLVSETGEEIQKIEAIAVLRDTAC